MTNVHWLRNASTEVGVSLDTGALVAYTDRRSGWSIIGRSELGLSFKLLVPLPGRRSNVVVGRDQAAPTVEADRNSVTLHWPSVHSEHGGMHAIAVTQLYALLDGRLVVTTSIDNRSQLVVENVFSPYLGDVRPRSDQEELSSIRHNYGSGMKQELWPHFKSTAGYCGVAVPTQLAADSVYGAPSSPFTLIQGDSGGLYVGVGANSSELLVWHTELWPGYGDSMTLRVPETREIGGRPVSLQFGVVHVPFIEPGTQRTLTPVFLEFYEGDWHAGANVYMKWRDSWATPAEIPDWAKEPHSWHQIQLNSAEDGLRLHFDELIEVGREAVAAGVKAIQLVGFNDGGQDRNNPSHAPDPRLGGYEGLRHAIAQLQELGLKVVLFAKFTWADRSSPEFGERFAMEAVKDPYGDYYLFPGFKYETVTQLLDINTRRLIPMCFLSESYLEECEQQFQTLVDLGADGILYDECFHHMPTQLCFDTSHGHRFGAPTYANDREIIRRFKQRLKPDQALLFAGEALYDWEFEVYGLSYHRSAQREHFPMQRYTQPHAELMTAVTGFNDRNMINQCLMYRYIVSYEPFNFKGRLPDMPDTLAYGEKMESLRLEVREWVWDGTFRDTVGATVTDSSGRAHHPYSVFQHESDGTRAVVVANYDFDVDAELKVTIEGYSGPLFAKPVDGPKGWTLLSSGAIVVLPRSAAIITERIPAGFAG